MQQIQMFVLKFEETAFEWEMKSVTMEILKEAMADQLTEDQLMQVGYELKELHFLQMFAQNALLAYTRMTLQLYVSLTEEMDLKREMRSEMMGTQSMEMGAKETEQLLKLDGFVMEGIM